MKCLLCNYQCNKSNEIKDHYLNHHNVDDNNKFFQRIIQQKKNVIYGKNCKYCDEFVYSNKSHHDFLKHYGKGLSIDGDLDKPINVINTPGLKKIEITYKDHSSYYDFFDSEAIVDSFLQQVKDVMKCNDQRVLIRSGFSIENIQQPLDNYSEPLLQKRYWSTEPLQTNFLNDYILFKIRESILKRVIINRLSGSTWNFNKFNYLNVKILNASYQFMR